MLCRCVMEVTEAGQMRELSMLSFRPDMDIKTVGWFQDDLLYFIRCITSKWWAGTKMICNILFNSSYRVFF